MRVSEPQTGPLKVIIIGYYGKQNAGDDLLRQAMEYIFQGHELMFTCWFPGVDVLNGADLVVVGGGSIWPDFTFFRFGKDIVRQLRSPLMILGISARRTPAPAQLEASQLMARKSRFFCVRDTHTAALFGRKEACKPDLFWWMPWEHAGPPASRCYAIAITLRDIEHINWDPHSVLNTVKATGQPLLPLPFHFGVRKGIQGPQISDVEYMKSLGFKDLPTHWSVAPLQQARFVVTMRYHGVLTAIRLGRPAITFDFHPKLTSLFEDLGIPELCVRCGDNAALADTIKLLNNNFEYYENKILAIRKQLRQQGKLSQQECRREIDQIAATRAPKAFSYRLLKSILGRI